MKEITMTIKERIHTINLFDSFKGSIVTYKSLLEDVKEVEFSEDEKKEIEYKAEKVGNQVVFNWNQEKNIDKKIKLSIPTVKYITDTIEEKDKKGELTMQDGPLITLSEKLKD